MMKLAGAFSLIVAPFLATSACSDAESRHLVTEFEQERPAAPSAGEVLVVDWTKAEAVSLVRGSDLRISFGGSRYGVVAIDSLLGSHRLDLTIPETIDPAVWLVAPNRRAVVFKRGRDAHSVAFEPGNLRGRFFLVVRDASFGSGEISVSLHAPDKAGNGEPIH